MKQKELTAKELRGDGDAGIVILDLRGVINDTWRDAVEDKIKHLFTWDSKAGPELRAIIRKVEQRLGN